MRVVVVPSPAAVGSHAAAIVLEGVAKGSVRVLGVSTGSSPVPVYQALAREEGHPLRGLEAFALDEYVGLPYSDPGSYHSVITRAISRPLGMDPSRVHAPDGLAEDLQQASLDYEEAIRAAGGVDLQILGVGRNATPGSTSPVLPSRPAPAWSLWRRPPGRTTHASSAVSATRRYTPSRKASPPFSTPVISFSLPTASRKPRQSRAPSKAR